MHYKEYDSESIMSALRNDQSCDFMEITKPKENKGDP